MNHFMQLCRLCTSDKNVLFTIHNLDSDGKCFIDKLQATVPEIVDCKIKLPSGICTICAIQLNDAYKFIKQCLDTQIILKQRQLNEQVCRLCSSNENISLRLNSMDSDNILISHKLKVIASEILACNEKLSNSVCSTCSVCLNETYKFVEKCFKSQEILKQQLQQNNVVIKNEIAGHNTGSCLNNEENNTGFVKKEIINEEYIKHDLETEMNIKIEESLESEKNTNFESVFIKEEYNELDLENDINIKTEESSKLENSGIIIKKQNSDFESKTDLKTYQADRNTNKNNILSSEENSEFVEKSIVSYKCTICEKTFINIHNLKRHICHVHTDKKIRHSNGSYKCEICKQAFTRRYNLNKHILSHTQEKPYKCEMCEKAFTELENIKRHICLHTKSFKCDLCKKSFTSNGNLKVHIRTHTNERRYKCEVCEKAFTQSEHLKRHIRSHTQERPYKCEMCDRAFTHSGTLKVHIRIHTQEKPYKCKMCEKTFTTSGVLKVHIRIHTQERPYQCETCEKAFTSSGDLTKHVRSHTLDKPYKCKMCDKAFSQNGSLKKHIVSHKKEKLINT